MTDPWLHTPVGPDAQRWATQRGCSTVLVVAHSVTAVQRLMDVASLLAADTRIQLVFTIPPSVCQRSVETWLTGLECPLIPWTQATYTRFDLAIAASYWGIERIHAPLVLLPHGAGFGKFIAPSATGAVHAPRQPVGLDRQRLVHDGRVIPSVLALAHDNERHRLARSCPEALSTAIIAGDAVADRLSSALKDRARFRRALGVGKHERLVVATSTWGPNSLLGARSDVLSRLVQESADQQRWRVALLAHPLVWAGHGPWQLQAWTADWQRHGLLVFHERTDCVAALAGADAVIGDHGSVSLYASLLHRPLLVSTRGRTEVDPQAPITRLLGDAPHIAESGPLLARVEALESTWSARILAAAAAQVSSAPGQFATRMRKALYEQLALEEPQYPARLGPTPSARLAAGGGGDRD